MSLLAKGLDLGVGRLEAGRGVVQLEPRFPRRLDRELGVVEGVVGGGRIAQLELHGSERRIHSDASDLGGSANASTGGAGSADAAFSSGS